MSIISAEKATKLEIEELEGKLESSQWKGDAKSVEMLIVQCRLSELYLSIDKVNKALSYLMSAIDFVLNSNKPISTTNMILASESALSAWKYDRYISKTNLRINYMSDRSNLLRNISNILDKILKANESAIFQKISFKQANVKESLGLFQESLSILSDLITAQAMDGVDLSYIIFKAAIILKHLEKNKQSIEYLEYLLEDPPETDGITKTHVLAFLILVYEQSGDKFKVFLPKCYKDFLDNYADDLLAAAGSKDSSDSKKSERKAKLITELSKNKNVSESSDVWEILALQALDRCDYVFAVELLLQAIRKAPNKGKLYHSLAEVCCLLGEKDQSLQHAEKAVNYLPNNKELRNLLLLLDPEKWTERIRTAGSTRPVAEDDSIASSKTMGSNKTSSSSSKLISVDSPVGSTSGGSDSWLSKMKNMASEKLTTFGSSSRSSSPSSSPSSKKETKTPNNNKMKKSRGGMDPIKETRDKNHPDRIRVQKPVKPEVGDEVKQMIRSVVKGDDLEMEIEDPILIQLVEVLRMGKK